MGRQAKRSGMKSNSLVYYSLIGMINYRLFSIYEDNKFDCSHTKVISRLHESLIPHQTLGSLPSNHYGTNGPLPVVSRYFLRYYCTISTAHFG